MVPFYLFFSHYVGQHITIFGIFQLSRTFFHYCSLVANTTTKAPSVHLFRSLDFETVMTYF